MGVGMIVKIVSRARTAGCKRGSGRTSGMGLGGIVEFDSRARKAGCKLGGG